MTERKDGLYDELITNHVSDEIQNFAFVNSEPVKGEPLDSYILQLLVDSIDGTLSSYSKDADKIKLANQILQSLGSSQRIEDAEKAKRLIALVKESKSDRRWVDKEPPMTLSKMGLVTNQKTNMSATINLEMRSSNSVDILMSFVRMKGITLLADEFSKLRERNVPVRLLTTVYTGATQKQALDYLVRELGVSIKINYDIDIAHLHAKAWLFGRDSGFSTAYIGSSNISETALTDGMEWNVRLSETSSSEILDAFRVSFNSYWASEYFEEYEPDRDGQKLIDALDLAKARFGGSKNSSDFPLFIPNIDVQPHEHQRKMLEDLELQREVFDRHRNLIVAATGTGKTVLAALDYKNSQEFLGYRPSLLFVAHRQEILKQSMSTFKAVLKDGNFGELFVDGKKPSEWRHVFASVQSLASADVKSFPGDQFDYIVIDEFHRAAANTYQNILDHFKPKELLALTATPERGDGKRVQDLYFDGVITSELRLWDAMERKLLAPFDYFGIAEDTDFTSIEWSKGGYSTSELEKKVTRNDLRDHLLLKQIAKCIPNPSEMKALVFCVGTEHATYISELLNSQGIKATALSGANTDADRTKAINDLAQGRLNAIVTVDIFNEGVDIPEVDSVIMLRPTESSVVFLQQLGRGLRRHPNKEAVVVLDFIGSHRSEFRMDKKFEALTGLAPGQLMKQVELGFPMLPGGMSINLDSIASLRVLDNIKLQLNYSHSRLQNLAKQLQSQSLEDFLTDSGLDLDELFVKTGWLELKVSSGLVQESDLEEGWKELASLGKRFLHIDDQKRIKEYSSILRRQEFESAGDRVVSQHTTSMLFWMLWPDAKLPNGVQVKKATEAFDLLSKYPEVVQEWLEILQIVGKRALAVVAPIEFKQDQLPLQAHATYLRAEILGAVTWARLEGDFGKKTTKAYGHQVGASYVEELELDLLFVNLNKDGNSATTKYKDFAQSKVEFHWESQNATADDSEIGKRYINQPISSHDVLICVRESEGGFKILGLADLAQHKGSKPIQIVWKLRIPMDVVTYELAAAFKVG